MKQITFDKQTIDSLASLGYQYNEAQDFIVNCLNISTFMFNKYRILITLNIDEAEKIIITAYDYEVNVQHIVGFREYSFTRTTKELINSSYKNIITNLVIHITGEFGAWTNKAKAFEESAKEIANETIIGKRYIVKDNSYCRNIKDESYTMLVQDGHNEYTGPNEKEEGAIFTVIEKPFRFQATIGLKDIGIYDFIIVQSSNTNEKYRVLYYEDDVVKGSDLDIDNNNNHPNYALDDNVIDDEYNEF